MKIVNRASSEANRGAHPLKALGASVANMFDYRRFDDVFPADAQVLYDRTLQQEIEKHRRNYDGVLFIDRVLKALGIAKGMRLPVSCSSPAF